jgi:hypothetical protein
MNREQAIKIWAEKLNKKEEEIKALAKDMTDAEVIETVKPMVMDLAKCKELSHFGKDFWLATAEQAVVGVVSGAAIFAGVVLVSKLMGNDNEQ